MRPPDTGIAVIQSTLSNYENNPVLNAILNLQTKMRTGQDGKLQLDAVATLSDQDCIIFDMDGTLIDNIPPKFRGFPENPETYKTMPIARPGLKETLAYAFANYKHVSIWTAGTDVWFKQVYDTLFKHVLPPGRDFHFVKTRARGEIYIPLKPLSAIYAQYPDYRPANTVIVDDNAQTFCDNVENAEHIPSFFYDTLGNTAEERQRRAGEDRELYGLIKRLKMRKCGFNRDVLFCVRKIFGRIYEGMDSITVPYSELCLDLDPVKIDCIVEVFRLVCPIVHLWTETDGTIYTLTVAWDKDNMHPIVFDKIIFPEDVTEDWEF
jgi:hypothetical protein